MTAPLACSCLAHSSCSPPHEENSAGSNISPLRTPRYPLQTFVRACQGSFERRCSDSLLCLLLVLVSRLLVLLPAAAATDVPLIRCECSTADCAAEGVTSCTTASLCYFQHFDHHDGSHPITRGCITSGSVNSLQCLNLHLAEQRRSSPYVVCCGSDYCNRDLPLPTVPYFPLRDGTDGKEELQKEVEEDLAPLPHHRLAGIAFHHHRRNNTTTTKGSHEALRLNTICLVVIGAAVAFMVTISVAGLCVVARYRSTYSRAPEGPMDVGMEKLRPLEPSAPPLVFAYHPASY